MSMFDLTRLSDDALRAALFDALVERLDARVHEDPSITLVNRMPTVVAVSRRGNLLTLSQGLGLWLLRGDLKSKDRRERLRTFNVGRATIQSKLAITPDGISGTPDEILDWIVALLLERTATGEESRPPVAGAIRESRSTAAVQQNRPTLREGMEKRRAPVDVARPPPVDVTQKSSPPAPTLRTYQLLFETAQRQLEMAKVVGADSSRYYLISAGVFAALTAEAFFNDLGSRVIPFWGQLQRLDPREKAEVLNIELFNDKADWSVGPFKSVAAALGFRRALAYAHAETLPFDQLRIADRQESEVPRTRRTAWQEHFDVATIQRWITDVRLLIEHFSRGHDPTEIPVARVEQP